MRYKIKNIIVRNSSEIFYWIFLSLLIKGILFIILLHGRNYTDVKGFWGITSGDFHTYILPIENLIRNGTYSPDFRMPGYGIVYFIIRLLFDEPVSLNLLIVIQFILSAISVYFLSITAKLIFRSERIFYLTFILSLLNTFSSKFDIYTQPESFCISALIFSVYFFVKHTENRGRWFLLLSGSFLAWAVFLRPVYVVLLLLFIPFIIFQIRKFKLRKYFINILIFLLPFIIFDSIWIMRNFMVHNKFIMLQEHINEERRFYTHNVYLTRFFDAWGGDMVTWNPRAEILWFHKNCLRKSKMVNEIYNKNIQEVIPNYIYTSSFNKDSLYLLKKYMAVCDDSLAPAKERFKYDNLLKEKFKKYTFSIINEKPFLYYVKAPLIFLKHFLFHPASYTYYVPSDNRLKKAIRAYNNFIYYLIILAGLSGLLMCFLYKFKFDNSLLIVIIISYNIGFYSFIYRAIEYRYLAPCIPFLIICGAYFIDKIASKLVHCYHRE